MAHERRDPVFVQSSFRPQRAASVPPAIELKRLHFPEPQFARRRVRSLDTRLMRVLGGYDVVAPARAGKTYQLGTFAEICGLREGLCPLASAECCAVPRRSCRQTRE